MVEEKIETIEEKKVDKEFWFKISTGILVVIAVITVLALRETTDISLLYPLIISGIIFIAFIVSLFGKSLYEKFKKPEEVNKIPEPLSKVEVQEMVQDIVLNKKNNMIRIEAPVREKTYNINNNIIYAFNLELYHPENWGGEITPYCIIIINATYPDINPTIMSGISSTEEILYQINAISRSPKDSPDTEETIVENPILGTKQTTVKRIHRDLVKAEEPAGEVV